MPEQKPGELFGVRHIGLRDQLRARRARGAAHLQADLDFLIAPHCQNIQRRIIDWAVEADISFFNIEFDAEDSYVEPRRARKSPCARKGVPAALLRVIFPTKSRSAPAPRKRKSLPRSIPTRVCNKWILGGASLDRRDSSAALRYGSSARTMTTSSPSLGAGLDGKLKKAR